MSSTNTTYGTGTGTSLTSGSNDTLIGYQAGQFLSTGSENTLLGSCAGQNTTGDYNTCIGYSAGMGNTSGSFNTYIGTGICVMSCSGSQNSVLGMFAGHINKGSNNTFIGYNAAANNDNGFSNVIIGSYSAGNLLQGSQNVVIGVGANVVDVNGVNQIAIGSAAVASQNQIAFPDVSTNIKMKGLGSHPFGATVTWTSDGLIQKDVSSARYKHDIKNADIDKLAAMADLLRPMSYLHFSGGPIDYGFIAEDVNLTSPHLVVTDKDNNPESIRYPYITVLLLAKIRQLSNELNQIKSMINNTCSGYKLAYQSPTLSP